MIRQWIISAVALAGLSGGGYLLYKTVSRAVSGDPGAVWVVVLFLVCMAVIVLGVRKFWVLVIDHSDVVDVFRESAARLSAEVRHFRSDHRVGDQDITESGYEFTWSEQNTEAHVQLFQIGRPSVVQERILFDDHTLLALRLSVERALDMAVVHPAVDITESLDIERYAPLVLTSHSYVFVKHGVVFSNDKSIVSVLFDNPFVQNLLAEIFYHYRFKFLVFQDRQLLAIKTVVIESLEQDIESYKLFVNLKDLIEENHKKLAIT